MIKNKNAWSFISATAVSRLGTLIFSLYLSYFIANESQSTSILGTVSAIAFLPNCLFNLVGGFSADRYSKKKLLRFYDGLSFIICLVVAFLFLPSELSFWQTITVLTLVQLFLNAIASLYSPTSRALIPDMLTKEEIENFNISYTLVSDLIKFIAPLLIGLPLLSKLSLSSLFFINALTFLISFLLLHPISYSRSDSKSLLNQNTKQPHLIKDILQQPALFLLMMTLVAMNFFHAAYSVALPFLATTVYQSPLFFSLAAALQSLGAISINLYLSKKKGSLFTTPRLLISCGIFGSALLLMGSLRQTNPSFSNLPQVGHGSSMIEMGSLFSTLLTYACIFILGGCFAYVSVGVYSLIQKEYANPHMGKVLGTLSATVMMCIPFSTFLTGLVGESLSVLTLLQLLGTLFLCLTFLMSLSWHHTQRKNKQTLLGTPN